MWKSVVALVVALTLPLPAFAQGQPADAIPAGSDGGSLVKTLAITGGVIGGLVVADLLSGGSLTAPLLRAVGLRAAAPAAVAVRAPLSPAIAEARAAGAVLGEQITAATEARDAAARSDIIYVGVLGTGALVGGWLLSHLTN